MNKKLVYTLAFVGLITLVLMVVGMIVNSVENESEDTEITSNIFIQSHNISSPEYSSTLDMNELRYKGEKVIWVYQIEKEIDDYTMEIIPCIELENEERYCAELTKKTLEEKE